MAMRYLALLFGLHAGVAGSVSASDSPNCGYESVEVTYSRHEQLTSACEALADILAYFRRIGLAFEPRFALRFAEPDSGKSVEAVVSYGHVDVRASLIVVYPSSHRMPWGLFWSSSVADSFLRHALAHIALWQIAGTEARGLAREWHEFIAYAVQLDLMAGEQLRQVLTNFPDIRAFEDLTQVNEFTYGMNPDVFAVSAYLTYRERGAQEFLRGLLRGEIVPPPFVLPFPAIPEAAPERSEKQLVR